MKIIIYDSSVLAPFEDVYAPLGGYTKILLTNHPIFAEDFGSYRDRFEAWLEDCELILIPQALWDSISKLIDEMDFNQTEEAIPSSTELGVHFAPTHPLSEFHRSLEFVGCYRIQEKQRRYHNSNSISSNDKAKQTHDLLLYMNMVVGAIIMGVVAYLLIPHGSAGIDEIKTSLQAGDFDKARKDATKIGVEKTVKVAIAEILPFTRAVDIGNIDSSTPVKQEEISGSHSDDNAELIAEYMHKAYDAISRRDLTIASTSGREPAIFYVELLHRIGETQHTTQLTERIIDEYLLIYRDLPGKLNRVLNTELWERKRLRNFATEEQKKQIERIEKS